MKTKFGCLVITLFFAAQPILSLAASDAGNGQALAAGNLLLSAPPYELIWSDEFDGTSVNTANWNFDIGGGGWGNNELEYYKAANAKVKNGILTITAKKKMIQGYNYTSARMKTQDKFDFKYGKVEARIKLPMGQGLWPAFWMLGSNINTVG